MAARTIADFRGEFGFLSNFASSPIEVDGGVYATVEHAFQAAKTLDPAERSHVAAAPTPAEAKRRGRRVTLRPDWEGAKRGVMLRLLRLKFQDPHLEGLLMATGDATLIEGNRWGDRTWGAVWEHGRWDGANLLGELLMAVRDEISGEAPDSLRFTAVDGAGTVDLGHGIGTVVVSVSAANGARAAVVLSPGAARRLGACLGEHARHAGGHAG